MRIYHLSQHVSPILQRCLFPESLGLFGNWPLKSANDSINLDTIYYYWGVRGVVGCSLHIAGTQRTSASTRTRTRTSSRMAEVERLPMSL